jgi:hypothetical protein
MLEKYEVKKKSFSRIVKKRVFIPFGLNLEIRN